MMLRLEGIVPRAWSDEPAPGLRCPAHQCEPCLRGGEIRDLDIQRLRPSVERIDSGAVRTTVSWIRSTPAGTSNVNAVPATPLCACLPKPTTTSKGVPAGGLRRVDSRPGTQRQHRWPVWAGERRPPDARDRRSALPADNGTLVSRGPTPTGWSPSRTTLSCAAPAAASSGTAGRLSGSCRFSTSSSGWVGSACAQRVNTSNGTRTAQDVGKPLPANRRRYR